MGRRGKRWAEIDAKTRALPANITLWFNLSTPDVIAISPRRMQRWRDRVRWKIAKNLVQGRSIFYGIDIDRMPKTMSWSEALCSVQPMTPSPLADALRAVYKTSESPPDAGHMLIRNYPNKVYT